MPHIAEGEVYTVVNSFTHTDGIPYYELKEISGGYYYAQRRFTPLSDISETTFERNYKTQPCTH